MNARWRNGLVLAALLMGGATTLYLALRQPVRQGPEDTSLRSSADTPAAPVTLDGLQDRGPRDRVDPLGMESSRARVFGRIAPQERSGLIWVDDSGLRTRATVLDGEYEILLQPGSTGWLVAESSGHIPSRTQITLTGSESRRVDVSLDPLRKFMVSAVVEDSEELTDWPRSMRVYATAQPANVGHTLLGTSGGVGNVYGVGSFEPDVEVAPPVRGAVAVRLGELSVRTQESAFAVLSLGGRVIATAAIPAGRAAGEVFFDLRDAGAPSAAATLRVATSGDTRMVSVQLADAVGGIHRAQSSGESALFEGLPFGDYILHVSTAEHGVKVLPVHLESLRATVTLTDQEPVEVELSAVDAKGGKRIAFPEGMRGNKHYLQLLPAGPAGFDVDPFCRRSVLYGAPQGAEAARIQIEPGQYWVRLVSVDWSSDYQLVEARTSSSVDVRCAKWRELAVAPRPPQSMPPNQLVVRGESGRILAILGVDGPEAMTLRCADLPVRVE